MENKLDTQELKKIIAEGHEDAFDLLIDRIPTASTRFHRLAGNMAKLLDDIREHFPEALFYTTGGNGFCLVLGDTHSGKSEKANNELIALTSDKLNVMGGDW